MKSQSKGKQKLYNQCREKLGMDICYSRSFESGLQQECLLAPREPSASASLLQGSSHNEEAALLMPVFWDCGVFFVSVENIFV